MTDKLQEVLKALNGAETAEGLKINPTVLNENEEMIQIEIEGREEFPIILDIDGDQITVIINLWDQSEVKAGAEAEMMSVMLSMNIALPLSSFAKTGTTYQLFGAMSINTVMENVVEEIDVLSGNALSVCDAFSDYLTE